MSSTLAILLARTRTAIVVLILGFLFADARWEILPGPFFVTWLAGIVLILATQRSGTLRRAPIPVHLPVAGRWMAYNSPATRVPSHGLQSHGQTYAIDFVADPSGGTRPSFSWLPIARPPRDYPGYGLPVYAPIAGTVARVHDRARDHLSRTSPLGVLYMFTIELVRGVLGTSLVFGNHVIIDRGDGSYVALAHLRHGSSRVSTGQRISAGDAIAQCGNSGNSSEPHLHMQVMDHPQPQLAAGIPFRLLAADGSPLHTPANGDHVIGSR